MPISRFTEIPRASRIKSVLHLIEGAAVLFLGTLLLWKQTDFLLIVTPVVSLLILLKGAAQTVSFLQKPKKAQSLYMAVLYLSLGAVLWCFPQIPVLLLPVLFSAYLMLDGVVKLTDTILAVKNQEGDAFFSLIPALFYLIFAAVLLFSPKYHIHTVLVCIAIYCILLGITYILDFLGSVFPVKVPKGLRRRLRITLPIFLAAFIPHTVLTKLNSFLSTGKTPGEFEDIAQRKADLRPDMEIFIHVAADRFFMTIGHCDIWFDGELIAYGNYDEASQLPIGMGPGVLLVSNKYEYLPFCLDFNKTTIFSFGLRLSEEQKEAVRSRIREIKSLLIPWDPEENPKNRNIFAAQLCRNYQAKCYKFKKGKFKTYFVMSTNCVLLADSIICKAGTDILDINGIISPGTLYDYLEAEFCKKDSMVISRSVYRLPLTAGELYQQELALPKAEDAPES